jgi:three-Cys-motif partner protein
VDCFSGPWNERSQKFEDTSFGIAIEQLRTARERLGNGFRIRCFFIERDRAAFKKLAEYAKTISDIEIETQNANFEDSVSEILKFVQNDKQTFPFFLIDPKGWSIPLASIRPLLQLNPSETLITFMLEFIRRFVGHPEYSVRQSFEGLYGEVIMDSRFEGLTGAARDDMLLNEYLRVVQAGGDYKYASSSLVLHPEKARQHFNLVYLTRHHRGIEVFKEAEKSAMVDMEEARAKSAQRQRTSRGQPELFPAEELHNIAYFDGLRKRALDQMETNLLEILHAKRTVSYDAVWALALRSPLVWPTDFKSLLLDLEKQGTVRIEGMPPGSRVPKLELEIRISLLRPQHQN